MDEEDQTPPSAPEVIYNADGTFTFGDVVIHGMVGPQGPPGMSATLEITGYDGEPITSLAQVPIPGTRVAPAIRFEVDGWEYSFRSLHHARLVREKLMQMTMEGDL